MYTISPGSELRANGSDSSTEGTLMLRVIAVLVGLVGLWLLVAGVASILGPSGQTGSVPSMGTSAFLGAIFLAGAILLWRRRAPQVAAHRTTDADVRAREGDRS